MDMNSLLESLYSNDVATPDLEKTAESALIDGLKGPEAPVENPFMEMSTADLIKMAQELEAPVAVEESTPEATAEVEVSEEDEAEKIASEQELEKVAFDMLGGQIMAHSMIHEFGLIKEAMAQGLCRVCKEQAMDVEGSSVCSVCLNG
tara:strand:+ start:2434 stop:2877 length:444 start_codon:yes stop_codon:yes gene_type:complete